MNEPDRKVKCNTLAVQVEGTAAAAAADERCSRLADNCFFARKASTDISLANLGSYNVN